MGELLHQLYLHPLTLDAQVFLRSLKEYRETCHQVDPVLITTLEYVLHELQKYLTKAPVKIVDSHNTKLVPLEELANISIIRNYQCTKCNVALGGASESAAIHLVDNHSAQPKPDFSMKLARKELFAARAEKAVTKAAKAEAKAAEAKVPGAKAADKIKAKPVILSRKTKTLVTTNLERLFTTSIQEAEAIKQLREYEMLESQLKADLSTVYSPGQVQLYKFGSRMSGIGTRNSDLDIFIDVNKSFNKFEQRASQRTLDVLSCVNRALKDSTHWDNISNISRARVPIIRVLHRASGIECDLGFSNSLGYCNTKLLDYLFSLQPISRRICVFLKKWLECTYQKDTFNTYTISLMVVYFLQVKKLLPSIEKLQADMTASVYVGPWLANFTEKTPLDLKIEVVDVNSEKSGKLLQEFFAFYSTFKYAEHVICPYFGLSTVKISLLDDAMPERYVNFIKSSGAGMQRKSFIVQDPLQLNHNVAQNISETSLKYFCSNCKETAAEFGENHR